MRQFFTFLAVYLLLTSAGGAQATERRLLAAGSFSQSLKFSPDTAAAFARLRSTAEVAGTVRVIVGLRVPFAVEGQLSAPEALLQRRDIARARDGLLKAIPDAAGRKL